MATGKRWTGQPSLGNRVNSSDRETVIVLCLSGQRHPPQREVINECFGDKQDKDGCLRRDGERERRRVFQGGRSM